MKGQTERNRDIGTNKTKFHEKRYSVCDGTYRNTQQFVYLPKSHRAGRHNTLNLQTNCTKIV